MGIAIFSTIVTFVGPVQSNLPAGKPSQKQTTFRFHAGLDGARGSSNGKPLSSAGGDIPDIRVWNERGKFLGAKYDPGKVKSGAYKDVTVSLSENNQPTYVLFTSNNDALCMAYITQKWTDGNQYGWVGNWADNKACKRSWYYFDIWVEDRKVHCAWIDRNGDVPTTGIQVHFPEFGASNTNKNRGKNYKKRDTLAIDDEDSDEEEFDVAETAPEPKPHAEPRPINPPTYQHYNDTRLVQSSDPSHRATFLCEDELSRGPDLVSLYEGLFCDMTTREILPLCGVEASSDCFDNTARQVKRAIASRDSSYTYPFSGLKV